MRSTAEKENYSKRILQQRWGRENQTHLHEGTQSDHDFIQHLIFIQESMRKTRQLAFFLVDLYILQKVTRNIKLPEKLPEVTGTSRGNPEFPEVTRERLGESFFNVS